MDHWSLVGYLLIALILVGRFQRMSLQKLSRDKETRQSKSERTVIFPDMNETEHSLPIFPGQERRTQSTGGGTRNTEGGSRNAEGGSRNAQGGSRNAEGGGRNAEGGSRNAQGGSRNAEGGSRDAQVGSRNAEGGSRNAEGGNRNAEGGSRNAEGGSRNAEGGSRNAEGGSRNAEGGSRNAQGGSRKPEGGTRNTEVGVSNIRVVTAPPTPVYKYVNYVGTKPPLAPRVDNFGQPFCKKNSKDTFCESVDDYPDTYIRGAISYSSEEFKELFGTQTIHPRKITPSDVSEETVCPQQARLFYPKAAVNENERWAYVVNDVDYVQTVMAEMCEGEGSPCSYLDGALPSGVSSACRQKFAYKRLLALHPDQKKTYTDAFRFPSCCVCYVTRPYILNRMLLIPVDDKKTDNRQSSDRNRGT